MATLREQDEQVAKKKGLVAGAVLAASVGAGVLATPMLLFVGLVPTAYLAYDWFSYRAKRGMRF